MTPTATAIARSRSLRTWAIHVAAVAWIALMFSLSNLRPATYTALLQEDYFVEWLTVGLFGVAGYLDLRAGWRNREYFTLLIGLFCVFVAGEEFSWGQRLLGFTPPDYFLEHNTQQEFTLHNFADVFGKPKGVLIVALLGYGLVLPLIGRMRIARRLGVQAPPLAIVPWLVACAALLLWYPLEFTGEWVEALAGGLFLVGARPNSRQAAIGAGLSVTLAVFLSWFSARGGAASPAALECARREAAALAYDVTRGNAATEKLIERAGSVHKRLWTAIEDGYIRAENLVRFNAAGCGDSQHFVIDPWGIAYWIRVDAADEQPRRVTVYSMGPNRRRDGDDIKAVTHF